MHRAAGSGPYNIPEGDLPAFKQKALSWASRFSVFVFGDSNGYPDRYGRYELLLGAGRRRTFSAGETSASLLAVAKAHAGTGGWIFGAMPYEAGESLFQFKPSDTDAAFWEPEIVVAIARGESTFRIWGVADPDAVAGEILAASVLPEEAPLPSLAFEPAVEKSAYLDQVESIRQKIAAGDFYEMNYCVPFSAGVVRDASPVEIFRALNARNPSPFAVLYKDGSAWTICASPERYLCRNDDRIYAQPIKGTARRGITPQEDSERMAALQANPKERAENIMIADLVRSDLANACVTGSIRVEELCAVYTYPTVHQMISTISGVPDPRKPFTAAIATSFPMGSMTGAPKKEVMKNIRAVEAGPRGLYSGSIGYINPDGDFDFNVVIRSLFYEAVTGSLGYWAGGAITWDSVPEEEWEEIRLKAAAMELVFQI